MARPRRANATYSTFSFAQVNATGPWGFTRGTFSHISNNPVCPAGGICPNPTMPVATGTARSTRCPGYSRINLILLFWWTVSFPHDPRSVDALQSRVTYRGFLSRPFPSLMMLGARAPASLTSGPPTEEPTIPGSSRLWSELGKKATTGCPRWRPAVQIPGYGHRLQERQGTHPSAEIQTEHRCRPMNAKW